GTRGPRQGDVPADRGVSAGRTAGRSEGKLSARPARARKEAHMSGTMTARGVHSAAQSVPPPSPRHRPLPAPRPAHTAVGQLHAARMGLAEAAEASSPAVRYVCAHLAALRAAAA